MLSVIQHSYHPVANSHANLPCGFWRLLDQIQSPLNGFEEVYDELQGTCRFFS